MKNKNYSFTTSLLRCLVITCLLAITGMWTANVYGQASSYTFAQSTTTYTTITGTTSTATGDDGTQNTLPIGFAFDFAGVAYTTFGVTTNGFIKFENGTTITTGTPNYTNAIGAASNAPLAAAFWDDNNLTGGSIIYATTGSTGSRVLTVQWTTDHIGGGGASGNPTMSFQVKLFEATGVIQFIYGANSGAFSSTTGSIGLTSASGNFISITPGAPGTASTAIANDNISDNTNLANGTTYTFTPPAIPFNDQCAGAEIIPSTLAAPYLTSVKSNASATITGDPALPTCQTNVARSIWYKFTPTLSGSYNFSACPVDAPGAAAFDQVMAIYTSSTNACGGTYTQVGCADDICSTQAKITGISLTSGTTYFIIMYGWSSNSGNIQLLVTPPPPCAARSRPGEPPAHA